MNFFHTIPDVVLNSQSPGDETFTSQVGSWIYTWSKDGKKIGTRAARQ